MKLVLPVAGKGTRMRPLTHTIAKPLIPVAEKPVLEHVIDAVLATQHVDVSEIIFITGHLGDQIESWARKKYDIPLRFVPQRVQNGSAEAIQLAEPYVGSEDMLIIFPDMLFDADLESLHDEPELDGIIWVALVDDPRRFGVVTHDEDGHMTGLVEKPEEPESNLVNIGMYYLRDSRSAFAMIDALYEEEIRTKGEYHFPEALDLMVKNGKRIKVVPVEGWHDCGLHDTTLATNIEFLKRQQKENSIHPSAVVEKSTLFNCIIMEGARIMHCDLEHSIVGPRSIIKHTKGRIIVGADSVAQGNDNR